MIRFATVNKKKGKVGATIVLHGRPNEKQKRFFESRARYTAYGGSRGGGKSWALRRKLILLALHYPGIRMILIRRSYPELRENHLYPLREELGDIVAYRELEKCFVFPNGSRILLGYMDAERDVLRYQGQEFDIIALDEATQLTEYQFTTLKACLRGANGFPKRMYLTCNPGGTGHAWVKRLFIDRVYNEGENPTDYCFIPARVYDNKVLTGSDPEYVNALKSLPPALRKAWLDGDWNVFDGQYFTEFRQDVHVIEPFEINPGWGRFAAVDYGFDMLAVLWFAVDYDGRLYVYREYCKSGLTLSGAADAIVRENGGDRLSYIVASPDLWNRRQDSGKSGFFIMSSRQDLPPLIKADDRRIIGWRNLREYLAPDEEGNPRLKIFSVCPELIRCLPALCHDRHRPEDVSGEPHSITHAPEALRYGVMSCISTPERENELFLPYQSFVGKKQGRSLADY